MCISSCLSYAQDIIIKTDSTKIFCRIIKEDASTISYNNNNAKKRSKIEIINKSDVLKYYNSATVIDKNWIPSDKDLLVKIDYANLELSQGDTIYKNKYNELEFRNGLINQNDAAQLMSHDKVAYKEQKKAKSLFAGYFLTAYLGCIISVIPFKATGESPTNQLKACGLILGGTFTIALPLKFFYKKHARKALKVYNAKYR